MLFAGCKTIYTANTSSQLPTLEEGKYYSVISISGERRNGKFLRKKDNQLWFKFGKYNSFIQTDQIEIIKYSVSPGGKAGIVLGSIVVGIFVSTLIYVAIAGFTMNWSWGT